MMAGAQKSGRGRAGDRPCPGMKAGAFGGMTVPACARMRAAHASIMNVW
jgi:hypothetical protein